MKKLGIIKKDKTAFVLIDAQEKLIPAMQDANELIKNINTLNKAAEILNIPLLITEQYPKGLGKTLNKIDLPNKNLLIEKTHFNCFESEDFIKNIKKLKINSLVIFGTEAHICILQTALAGLEKNFEIHVVADAVSSRTKENKNLGIERMKQSGIFITSTEMILFQLLNKAGTEEFKIISKLIK